MNVLVINGPNLARLDIRDSAIYGDMTYPQLVAHIKESANTQGFAADVRQSDDEATIISWLHEAADKKLPVIVKEPLGEETDPKSWLVENVLSPFV